MVWPRAGGEDVTCDRASGRGLEGLWWPGHRYLQPRSTTTRLCMTVVEDWVCKFRPQFPDAVDVR